MNLMILFVALSSAALATPVIVTDPVTPDSTACVVYFGNAVKATAAPANGRCEYDVTGAPPNTWHFVRMSTKAGATESATKSDYVKIHRKDYPTYQRYTVQYTFKCEPGKACVRE